MKRILKLLVCTILCIVTICSSTIPALASSVASPYFTGETEILGYRGRTYTISKPGGAVIRTEPHDEGTILDRLPEGFPLTVNGLYRTKKGTSWFKIGVADNTLDYAYQYVWIFAGNLETHSHNYSRFDGFYYEFCDSCGHLRKINDKTLDESLDEVELALSILSLTPGIGNGFDVIGGLVALSRGHIGEALLNFGSAIPILGYGGNASKVVLNIGDTIKASTRAGDFIYIIEKIDGGVVISSTRNTYRLRKHMALAYDATKLQRYYNYAELGVAVDAHHIVAIGSKDSGPALKVLLSLAVDPNGAVNGVNLCRSSEICGTTIHKYLHSKEYYDAVNKRILAANSSSTNFTKRREAVIRELDSIANDLVNNRKVA